MGNKIGRITTRGVITEFPIPTPSSGPQLIASGKGNTVWFAESNASKIGEVATKKGPLRLAGCRAHAMLPSSSALP